MKNELIEKITTNMKNLVKTGKDTLYLSTNDFTAKYDIESEFIFISLSCEDLKEACYTTYCDPTLFEDVSMYDLECLEDYDDSDLNNIYNLLERFEA